jgi:hypothetical protein
MAENQTMLSRSGNSGDGKKTSRIDVPVSEELESEIITMATLDGMTKAEWVRYQIEKILHGEIGMTRRMRSQTHKGNGKNGGSSSDELGWRSE